ncbi:MAG: hypothetical protein V1928_01785 [Parcubacteria group bacterium]
MSLLRYLIILGVCTGLCLVAWLFVVFSMNPAPGSWLAIILFYLCFGLFLAGAFSIVGSLLRCRLYPEDVPQKHVQSASRQGILLGVLMIIALILQSMRALTWWNFIIIVLAAGFVELFFISYKKFNR